MMKQVVRDKAYASLYTMPDVCRNCFKLLFIRNDVIWMELENMEEIACDGKGRKCASMQPQNSSKLV